MPPQKILVVGAIQGQLRKAIEKISKLHAKNDFAFAIAVGDLFLAEGEDGGDLKDLLAGSLIVPLRTYFTLGDSSLPPQVIQRLEKSDSDEVVPNLIYLGRKSTLTTPSGIKLVVLGGKLVQSDLTITLGKFDPSFYEMDARSLNGAHTADILITNVWPLNISNLSDQPLPEILRSDQGSKAVSDLCAVLKPRYHFSSTPAASWEREAFKHPQAYDSFDDPKITRFRSLASIQSSAKQWMSAFNLDPKAPTPASDATMSPFTPGSGSKRRRADDEGGRPESFSRFADHQPHQNGGSNKRQRQGAGQDNCFMCVNRSDFQQHMLVSIGNESILTVPKGPLPLASTFPDLSFSGHVLIIPTHHAGDGPRPAREAQEEFEEMTKYRNALCQMLQSKGQGRLGAVCWDANRIGIRHMHWQFIAAPVELIKKGLVEAAFRALREMNQYAPFQKCDPESQLEKPSDYFRIWIWTPHEKSSDPIKAADEINSGGSEKGTEISFFFPLPADGNFNIWFGRDVMARLLKLENRVNWKNAVQSAKLEEEDAVNLRADFQEFDFAMRDVAEDI